MMEPRKSLAKRIEQYLGYKPHQMPKKCCGNCCFSYITNPGASIPGLGCKIMDAMGRISDDEYARCQVDDEAVCLFYNHEKKND